MADSDRFEQIPYAGLNPDNTTVSNIGIDGNNGTAKIACFIANSGYQVQPVYYCKVSGMSYGIYFSVYNTEQPTHHMSIKSAYSGVSREDGITTRLTVGTATVYYLNPGYSQYLVDVDLEQFSTVWEAVEAFMNMFPDDYVNIQYVGNGCSVAGPSYVMEGTGVLVPVTLPIGATLSSGNISVTKNGSPIDFNYNPQTQQIAFTAI